MKIAVIGAGTVGVLSVCHFLGYNKNTQITCIHNPKKNILGIGESSTVRMTELLWNTLNFNVGLDGEDLQCTIKAGVKFKNWRKIWKQQLHLKCIFEILNVIQSF